MSLFRPSLQALLRHAQDVLEHRQVEAAAPVVLWQALGEADAAFDARVEAVVRRGLLPGVTLLAVCGPRPSRQLQGIVHVELPPKLLALLHPLRRARYRVSYSGRGAGKSWAFARGLIVRALEGPVRILCARELMASIQESTHRLLSDQIEALGLLPWFEIQQTRIEASNGSEFIFAGVRTDVSKLKSTEGVGIAFCEEAERFSARSWEVLIPTVRAPGSEFWVSFNPDQESDPTYQRFVRSAPPDAIVEQISWRDNPWFPAELAAEKDYLQRVDPDAAAHVWEGGLRTVSDAQIFRGKYVVKAFEPVERPKHGEQRAEGASAPWDGPYYGADWGFAQDPTTLVRCWVFDRVLYVEHEAYAVGCDIDRTPALFDSVPGAKQAIVRADSARPETISYLVRNGYGGVVSVEKWSGSVEDGIAFLRAFERIVIHPRCAHAIEEFRLYSFKTDRLSGDILPEPCDANNHLIDALRYALAPLIRRLPGWGTFEYMRQQAEALRSGCADAAA